MTDQDRRGACSRSSAARLKAVEEGSRAEGATRHTAAEAEDEMAEGEDVGVGNGSPQPPLATTIPEAILEDEVIDIKVIDLEVIDIRGQGAVPAHQGTSSRTEWNRDVADNAVERTLQNRAIASEKLGIARGSSS